jgi:hypothetical protein
MNVMTALLDRIVPSRSGDEQGELASNEAGTESTSAVSTSDTSIDSNAGIEAPPTPSIDEADLDDEDVVLRQLIAHGGRVSRSTLVAETGWEESDLDDVLRGMEADAQISTIKRRDPLVCRRGFEPAGGPLRFKND